MGIEPTTSVSIAQVALKLSSHGLSIIPVASMETKAPRLDSWRQYTKQRAGQAEVGHWFTSNGVPAAAGMGIVCGLISGGLVVIDFDTDPEGFTLFHDWSTLVQQFAPGLLETLPIVSTPSGGFHVYFTTYQAGPNTKLAMAADRTVRIETRGEGGYVIAPPSPGYELTQGRISAVPRLSVEQRDLLLNAARSLDAAPKPPPANLTPSESLPGGAYNMAATMQSVSSLLEAHGWTIVSSAGRTSMLRRPGKTVGTSASLSVVDGVPVFYSFSTNSAPLPSGQGLYPFTVYTHLEHAGDFHAAASALGSLGLGNAAKHAPVPAQVDTEPKYDWRKQIVPASVLLATDIPDIAWVVDGVIPFGLTLLAGSPKSGKSRLGWNIAVAVSTGGMALGNVPVQRRRVLYMMLEDGKRLVQKRLRRTTAPGADLSLLDTAEGWRKLTDGGVADIAEYCEMYPDALVVIDTYESLRGDVNSAHDSYRNDYGALKPLADLAHDKSINVLLIHHTNKRGGEDPYMSINGSHGLSGVADTLGILQRRNDSDEVALHVRGRELDADAKLALSFDPESGTHTLLGDVRDIGVNRDQQAIIAFLRSCAGPVGPKQIAQGVGRDNDAGLRMQLGRMVDGGTLVRSDYGLYTPADDPETVTGVTHPPALDPSGQFPDVEKNRGCVTPVTPGPEEDPVDPENGCSPTFRDIDRAIQAVPCPSCSKMYTKKMVNGDPNNIICNRCGLMRTPV